MDIKWKSAHTTGFSLILKKNPRLLSQSTRTKPHFAPLPLSLALLQPTRTPFCSRSVQASFKFLPHWPCRCWSLRVERLSLTLLPPVTLPFLTNSLPTRFPPCQSLSGLIFTPLQHARIYLPFPPLLGILPASSGSFVRRGPDSIVTASMLSQVC